MSQNANKRGFTLIELMVVISELMVVISVLGLLLTLALVAMDSAKEKTLERERQEERGGWPSTELI